MYVCNNNGDIVGDDKITEHATQYYKNLFGSTSKPKVLMDPNCWAPTEKITETENELIEPFTVEDIKEAILSMEKSTPPHPPPLGPDHMPF